MRSATGTHEVLGEDVLLEDRHVPVHHQAAVEGGDRRLEVERLDEHLHAAGRAAAGDGEEDAGVAQAVHGGDGVVGQDLVLGDQRPVHVGQEQADGLGGDVPLEVVRCRGRWA